MSRKKLNEKCRGRRNRRSERKAMANPIDTLKKIRGATWTELRSRSEQVFSAYTDQIGLSGKLPTDDEFTQLVDKSFFSGDRVTPETVYQKYFEISHNRFFPSF